jgi:hypothetical protein
MITDTHVLTPKTIDSIARELQAQDLTPGQAGDVAVEIGQLNANILRNAAALNFDDGPHTFPAMLLGLENE